LGFSDELSSTAEDRQTFYRNRLPSNPAKRVQETAMHWRKVPGEANSQAFYVVALIAVVALTATLLLHLHVPPR
jgi:hypothetical protein